MSNYMELATEYLTDFNEPYKGGDRLYVASLIEAHPEIGRGFGKAHDLAIPRFTLDGPAEYDRDRGYVRGKVSLEWQIATCEYQRGRIFKVDALDEKESQGVISKHLIENYIKEEANPEFDAWCFEMLCSGGTDETQNITTTDALVDAIIAGQNNLDDEDFPRENRILFISPSKDRLLMKSPLKQSIYSSFDEVIVVPQSRFITEIVLLDGTTAGQEGGGFIRGSKGVDINFMIVYKPAILAYHNITTNAVSPDQDPSSDFWTFKINVSGAIPIRPGLSAAVYTNHK